VGKKAYITIPELARILGISRVAVYKKVRKGQIKAAKIGRAYAIPGKYVTDILGQALNQQDGKQMNRNVAVRKDQLAAFCGRHHIRRLAIFGSALRDDFGPESDLDVLVDFMPGHVPGFFRLFEMEEELSGLFGGRKVELRTPEDLSRYFRDQVVATAEVQYVRR